MLANVSFVAACWMFAPFARIQHLLPGHICQHKSNRFSVLGGPRGSTQQCLEGFGGGWLLTSTYSEVSMLFLILNNLCF